MSTFAWKCPHHTHQNEISTPSYAPGNIIVAQRVLYFKYSKRGYFCVCKYSCNATILIYHIRQL